MARLDAVFGVTHSPLLPRAYAAGVGDDAHPGLRQSVEWWDRFRNVLRSLQPDVLLVVGCDHLAQWFTDNMPAFLIGKARRAPGTFWHEHDEFGIPPHEVLIDNVLATQVIAGAYARGVDVAFSDELRLDHSFVVPLQMLDPDAELPIVPVHANVMAPPLPPAARFYEVGKVLAEALAAAESNASVVAIVSGHLSVEVGGPRMMDIIMGAGPIDPEFDRRMTELIGRGDIETLIAEATMERMTEAGHIGGTGFMTFLTALGLAGGDPPVEAIAVDTGTSSLPFYRWDLAGTAR